METENKIVKKGRSRAEKERLLLQWKESGKTRKEFCQEQGINYGTFATWPRECITPSESAFKEIKLGPSTQMLFAQVHYPGGIRMDFFQPVSSEFLRSLK